MKLDRFVSERTPIWNELADLVARARGKPDRLDPQSLRLLGRLYRSAAADLALARRRWPSDPSAARLEELVGRARSLVYDSEARRGSLLDFAATGYWKRIAERPVPLVVAAVLLLLSGLIAIVWGLVDPDAATRFIPPEYRSVTERRDGADLALSTAEQAAFASVISTNNIRVSFLAFASGITAGIGTAWLLVFNGSLLGAVGGLAGEAGNGSTFTRLVVAHGVLELSCIIVTGAAGLRVGWTMVAPGNRKRGEAVVEEARRAVEVVLGTAVWLIVAALIEGFVTPRGLGLPAALLVGFGVAAVYWTLVWTRGRRSEAAAPLRPEVRPHASAP